MYHTWGRQKAEGIRFEYIGVAQCLSHAAAVTVLVLKMSRPTLDSVEL